MPDDRAGPDAQAAPPETEARNAAPAVTREYATDRVRVQWNAARCIHGGDCIRALPRVFNPRRRPWIMLEGADADAVIAAVQCCPSGALQAERLDGAPPPAEPGPTQLRATRDGPYYVRGDVELRDEQGRLLCRGTRLALCRCGQSRRMPLCDNSHRAQHVRLEPR